MIGLLQIYMVYESWQTKLSNKYKISVEQMNKR